MCSFEWSYQFSQFGCVFTRWKACCLCIRGQKQSDYGIHQQAINAVFWEVIQIGSIRLCFHLMESLLPLYPTAKLGYYKKTTIEIIETHVIIKVMKFSNDGT